MIPVKQENDGNEQNDNKFLKPGRHKNDVIFVVGSFSMSILLTKFPMNSDRIMCKWFAVSIAAKIWEYYPNWSRFRIFTSKMEKFEKTSSLTLDWRWNVLLHLLTSVALWPRDFFYDVNDLSDLLSIYLCMLTPSHDVIADTAEWLRTNHQILSYTSRNTYLSSSFQVYVHCATDVISRNLNHLYKYKEKKTETKMTRNLENYQSYCHDPDSPESVVG